MGNRLKSILPARHELHPILFAVYPISFLYAYNIDRSSPGDLILPVSLSLALAVIVYVLAALLSGSSGKGGILTTWVLLASFSYGHVFASVIDALPGETEAAKHGPFALFWLGLFGIGVLSIFSFKGDLPRFNAWLSMTGLFLVAMSLMTAISYAVSSPPVAEKTTAVPAKSVKADTKDRPDIYYLLLDGYGRADTLADLYDFDNSDFLDHLKEQGFFVASKSTANYNQTSLAVTSALNLDYIQNLLPAADWRSSDKTPLEKGELRENPAIIEVLSKYGYRFVTFSTGYSGTELRTADLFLRAPGSLSEFQHILLKTTIFAAAQGPLTSASSWQYESRRKELSWTLEHLPDMSQSKEPFFVFAHVLAPHPPFVFGPNGEKRDPDYDFNLADGSAYFSIAGTTRPGYIKGYREQARYLNKLVQKAVDRILAESERPPIIIIQSDHGPGLGLHQNDPKQTDMKERLSNLVAVYLPNGNDGLLYDSITPINVMRAVLDGYFEGTELLEDKSYYSPWARPYRYFDVTEEVSAN